MRSSDWSSDVCSSDLLGSGLLVLIVVVEGGAVDRKTTVHQLRLEAYFIVKQRLLFDGRVGIEDGTRKMWRASRLITLGDVRVEKDVLARSEEHTSELQSLMRISYAVFCLKKKK